MQKYANDFRCGFAAIVGRPNTGKSTLLNAVVRHKVAIVTQIPQTTRQAIRGIYNDARAQIIFVDTPGLHMPKDRLGKLMNKSAQQAIEGVDVVIHLMDTSRPPGKEEERIIERLAKIQKPLILGLNKIDLKGKYLNDYLALWQRAKEKDLSALFNSLRLMPLSGQTGIHRQELIETVIEFLPRSVPLFPRGVVSDFPEQLFWAELVREKLFNLLREEIPYGLTVSFEDVAKRRRGVFYISMVVYVDRDSQRKIVIGAKARVLKEAGREARRELEGLLKKKIYLALCVKTKKAWRDDKLILEEGGFEGR